MSQAGKGEVGDFDHPHLNDHVIWKLSFLKDGEGLPRGRQIRQHLRSKRRNYKWSLPSRTSQPTTLSLSLPGPWQPKLGGRGSVHRDARRCEKQEYPGWWFRVGSEAGLVLPAMMAPPNTVSNFLLILLSCLIVNGFEIHFGYWAALFKNIPTLQRTLRLMTFECDPLQSDIFPFEGLAELGRGIWWRARDNRANWGEGLAGTTSEMGAWGKKHTNPGKEVVFRPLGVTAPRVVGRMGRTACWVPARWQCTAESFTYIQLISSSQEPCGLVVGSTLQESSQGSKTIRNLFEWLARARGGIESSMLFPWCHFPSSSWPLPHACSADLLVFRQDSG